MWEFVTSKKMSHKKLITSSELPCCRKFATNKENSESEQRTMHALTHRIPRVFIWVVRGAMHSGKKWRSALWLNAVHSGKKWSIREFVPPYIFLLNSDYVAARSLCSLRSKNITQLRSTVTRYGKPIVPPTMKAVVDDSYIVGKYLKFPWNYLRLVFALNKDKETDSPAE